MSAARKERRKAERAMKKLARPAGKHNCGFRLAADLGLTDMVMTMTGEAIAEHGMPPSSAEIAAAHEAGHLIVALALGGSFRECYIESSPHGWQGYNEVFVDGVHSAPGDGFKVSEQPLRAIFHSMQNYGGIAGENEIGKYHPASSIEEYLITAKTLGAAVKGDWDKVQNYYDATQSVVTQNRAAFDHARGLLERNHRITSAEAEEIRAMLAHRIDVSVALAEVKL